MKNFVFENYLKNNPLLKEEINWPEEMNDETLSGISDEDLDDDVPYPAGLTQDDLEPEPEDLYGDVTVSYGEKKPYSGIFEGYYDGYSKINKIATALGYSDEADFFQDNPGAEEAVAMWVADWVARNEEWKNKLQGLSPDELEEMGLYGLDLEDEDDGIYEGNEKVENISPSTPSSMVQEIILQFLEDEGIEMDSQVKQYVDSAVKAYELNPEEYSGWTGEDFVEDFNNWVGDKLDS